MNDLITSKDLMCREEIEDDCAVILSRAVRVELAATQVEEMPHASACFRHLEMAERTLTAAIAQLKSKIKE